jgi:alanyl-tRNA synthetase
MTLQEIEKAENLVNFYIKQNSATKTAIMNLEEARASGAEALFGEKYDNDVRVISMGFDEENKSPYSIELCGGTHVSSTLEIEFFKIISEKSVASGIRRIEAMTGKNAKKFVLDEVNELQEKFMAQNLIISKNQDIVNKNRPKFELENFNYDEIKQEIQDLRQKIEKQEQEIKIINKQEEQEKQQNLLKTLEKSLKIEKIGEIDFITHIFEEIEAKDLREIANSLKNKHKNTIFALFSTKQDKISAIVAICDDLIAKFDASVLIKDVVEAIGGKGGGGKKDIAMGGGVNFEGIKKAIEAVKLKI